VTKSIDWFGTVRGRVGFLVTPQWLLYATGGLAYGETKSSFNTVDVSFGCVPNVDLGRRSMNIPALTVPAIVFSTSTPFQSRSFASA
jgi:outer membrane immunogenic protein